MGGLSVEYRLNTRARRPEFRASASEWPPLSEYGETRLRVSRSRKCGARHAGCYPAERRERQQQRHYIACRATPNRRGLRDMSSRTTLATDRQYSDSERAALRGPDCGADPGEHSDGAQHPEPGAAGGRGTGRGGPRAAPETGGHRDGVGGGAPPLSTACGTSSRPATWTSRTPPVGSRRTGRVRSG